MQLDKNPKRVLVIGNSGTGKSTLSFSLGRILDIPVHHLDQLFWSKGWVQVDFEEFRKNVEKLISNERWYIKILAGMNASGCPP